MKQPKPNTLQLHLPLGPSRDPAILPVNKQRDLAHALAELLLRAAVASSDRQSERQPNDESEAHA